MLPPWAIFGIIGILTVATGIGLGVGLTQNDDFIEETSTTTTKSTTKSTTTRVPVPTRDYIVETNYGDIRGFSWDVSKPYSEEWMPEYVNPAIFPNDEYKTVIFQGVPYAKPPVGDLRWRSPQKMDSWDHILNTTKPGSSCAPNDLTETWGEDCLYLNIFAPKRAFEGGEKVPVAVWYHGGAFSSGTGSMILYDGRHIAYEMDMIIVTVNYRLGALGFLMWNNIEEGEISNGNWGILDQTASLEWVQENIEQFGGDKDKVMIYGQSAGAISVAQHLIYEKSIPLFKSIVMHSNPLTIACKDSWEAGIQANYFAKDIGCPTLNLKCMREKTADEVRTAQRANPTIINRDKLLYAAMPFSPVVDGVVIKEQPFNSLRHGNYDSTKNIIIGITEHETEIYVRTLFKEPVNDITMKAGMRAIFNAYGGKDLVDAAIQKYNDLGIALPYCNSSISLGETKNFQNLFPEIAEGQGGFLNGLLSDISIRSDNCKTLIDNLINCSDLSFALQGICNNLVDQLCNGIDICDPEEFDERNSLEVAASDLVFVCPMRAYGKVDPSKQGNIWMYQFRDIMPADLSFVLGKNYERCWTDVSCHAADLSYTFALERRIDCVVASSGEGANVFHTCPIVEEPAKKMERSMHRYWANLAREGDPNKEELANYPVGIYENDGELYHWNMFSEDESWLAIQSLDGKPLENEKFFKKEVCDFWDEWDAYLNI